VQPVDYRKYIPDLPESVMYFNHHSAAVYASLQGYDYNTKLVPPNDVPKSFSDLLNPVWKGRIATSAYQGNFISYIGLPSVMGHQGMIDFITKFSSQVGGLFPCGEIDRVVSGEFWLFGVDCGDYEVRKRQRKGEPIAEMYPKEGTMMTYLDPSVPLTARHPAAARLFVTFLLTREGQDLLWNVAGTDNDRLPGSHMAPIIAQLRRQGVKFVDGMTTAGLPEMSTYAKEISAIINQGR
jgi:iron(III) transport system substrate-binding protein